MTYYEILEVEKDATAQEIKKAYRKLSLKYHPDKPSGDAEKFKQINEAYQTLSENTKKQQYDLKQQFGGGMNGIRGLDPNIINMMFGGGMKKGFPFNFGFSPGQGNNMPGNFRIFRNGVQVNGSNMNALRKPTPIIKTITIDMSQAYTGMKYPFEVERWIQEDDNLKRIETETIYIDIPAGIDNNEIIIVREKGNIISDDNKGDIKLFIKINNNTKFERRGLELLYNKTISLKESLCGFKFDLTFINGKTFTIDNTNGRVITPNFKKMIQTMGMKRSNHTGNLIITFIVKYPTTLTKEQRDALNNIL